MQSMLRRFVRLLTPKAWANVGLVALGIAALVLSILAFRSVAPRVPTQGPVELQPSTSTAQPSATARTPAPSTSATPSPSTSAQPAPKVAVFLGDEFTVTSQGTSWVDTVAAKMGWDGRNLAVAGMGYRVAPATCPTKPCTAFEGQIGRIAKLNPSVVVIAGGNADGDYDISPLVTSFYSKLKGSLPKARIIAVSPLWSGATTPPFWLTLHGRNIKAAATAVGGSYLDIGQPLVGKPRLVDARGRPTADGHAAIAASVLRKLS